MDLKKTLCRKHEFLCCGNIFQNYFWDGTHAYTEDFVLVYNLGIHDPSRGVDINFIREYTVKNYGKVKDCFLSNERSVDIHAFGYICFFDPKDAALMLHKLQHKDSGKRFLVGALYSWLQPKPHLAARPVENANQDMKAQDNNQAEREEAAGLNGVYRKDGWMEKTLLIRSLCYWQQPSPRLPVIPLHNANPDVDASPYLSRLNLSKVNSDCLNVILDFLPLVDRIQFARTCKRFLEVFQDKVSYKYRRLNLNDLEGEALTTWQKRDFINFCGKFVKNLTVLGDWFFSDNCWADAVVMGCPNVVTLTVKSVYTRVACLIELWHIDSEIRELTLEYCGPDCIGKCLEDIGALKHLEILSLNGSSCKRGFDLSKVSSRLQKLYLRNSRDIEPKIFISALKNMKNLTVLDVRGCDWLTKKVFDEITVNCRSLKTLGIDFTNSGDFESIANLTCLKEFLLDVSLLLSICLNPAFLSNLVKSHSENLEMLRIDGRSFVSISFEGAEIIGNLSNVKKLYMNGIRNLSTEHLLRLKKLLNLEELRLCFCTTISIDGLLDLLKSCTKLKYLNIQGCPQIIKDEMKRIIVLLKNQLKTGERQQKLHLMLSENSTDAENYLSTCDYKSVLKIVHKSEAHYYGECFQQTGRFGDVVGRF